MNGSQTAISGYRTVLTIDKLLSASITYVCTLCIPLCLHDHVRTLTVSTGIERVDYILVARITRIDSRKHEITSIL